MLRLRDAGIVTGILEPGPLNAITDVASVLVGQATLNSGTSVRTGVTAILPHQGNLFQDKVPAAVAIGNGYGKFAGSTQVEELGELETPILLTNTLSVPEASAAIVEWTMAQPGNRTVRSINPVVGETNDGTLNDIRSRHVKIDDGLAAILQAKSGPVDEGAVGAGTGTIAFEFKGGIGTSSRKLPAALGGYTVGALVQSNYGGILTINGVPVGLHLGRYYFKQALDGTAADGSIIVVLATDAPLTDRNLRRLAARAFVGIGRTGSVMADHSGDYAIAFSTAEGARRTPERRRSTSLIEELPNDRMTPLFFAAIEATEEAILNSLFMATTTAGHMKTVDAVPIPRIQEILAERSMAAPAAAFLRGPNDC